MNSRDPKPESDDERRVRARQLYEEIGPQILRLGFRYFGSDMHAAEDLVSETFAHVIVGLSHFRGQSSIRTWIFRIAMNVAGEWTQRSRARVLRETECARSEDDGREGAGLEQLLDRERGELIRLALMKLSDEHRMVLSLVVEEGLQRSEISELLGVPEGTLWSRYARARVALARELERAHVV